MLIGTALMITLSFLLSSAQSQAPPSPECIAAYNATFSNEATGSCEMAYFALIGESATDDQRMMVCNSDQQCNTMLESIISACGNTVSVIYHYLLASCICIASKSVTRDTYVAIVLTCIATS